MELTARAKNFKLSGIREVFTAAEKYDNKINFGIGEPGFKTPQHIIDKACWALNNGYTKYVANAGIMPLREAIAKKYNTQNGFSGLTFKNVMVHFGATQSLMAAMQCILEPGDELLVPCPYFGSYKGMAELAGATVVEFPVYEKDKFHVKAAELEKYITKKTKALIFNSPCNPTGAVTSKEDMLEIAELAKKYDFYVIADEPYETFAYDGIEVCSFGSLPDMFDRTITCNAFSKTYAMTGWRLGYMVAPENVIDAAIKLQTYLTVNAVGAFEVAAIEALEGPQDSVAMMAREYQKRRDIIVKGLNEVKGVSCIKPEGAFYAFANIRDTGLTSRELTFKLLEEVQLVTVPGSAFGSYGEGFLRCSYCCSEEDLIEGIVRMKKCLGEK